MFAPNCKHRHRIIPNPAHQSAREPHPSRRAPMSWMQRLKRVFHIDIEHCGMCGGTLRVIACIETPLKCRSLRELAHSSRKSSPISPRARPAASITPAHRRSIPRKPNLRPPHYRPCPDCARPPERYSPVAPRLPCPSLSSAFPPSRHAFLFAGAKSHHPDRDSSALVPMSNPTTTGPILPQPSQSTLYSSYPGKLTSAPSFRIGCIGRLGPAEMRGALAAVEGILEEMGVASGAPCAPPVAHPSHESPA